MNPIEGRQVEDLAQRLFDADDVERFSLVASLATDPATHGRLTEAVRLLAAIRGSEATTDSVDGDAALELARGRIARSTLLDPDGLAWVLASLAPLDDLATEDAVSAATRAALTGIVTTPRESKTTVLHRRDRFGRRRIWLPALGAAAAAMIAAVMLMPASEPWAERLDLNRAQVWRMPGELSHDLERALAGEPAGDALFPATTEPTRRERIASATGVVLPQPRAPRREAVGGGRPGFAWAAQDGGRFELLLLDAERRLLWSSETTQTTIDYPDDQASLEPGAIYYWKVNVHHGDQIVASPFVPFRTLSDGDARSLAADLRAGTTHPFIEGVAYERHGLYTAAAEAYRRAAEQESLSELATARRAAVLDTQGLAP